MFKFTVSIFISFIILPLSLLAYTSPGQPNGFVNDFAKILTVENVQALNERLTGLKNTTGAEVTIVTVSSLGDETIETYSTKLVEEWGIGVKGKDNGLLILIAPNERQARFEVGYGLEGAITDLQSSNIINKVMTPAFKAGDYYSGLNGAVEAVTSIITNSPEAAQYFDPIKKRDIDFGPFIFIVIILVSFLARILGRTKSWWLGGVLGATAGVIIGLIFGFLFYGIGAIVILTILGLIFDFFVSKGGPGGKSSSGFWFGPGMGGHGGGGCGGFGGGMAGGGGASGRW